MARVLRGLGSLVVLLAGVVGAPLALVALGGNPLPSQLSWSALAHALLTPDDGTILFRLIALVAWIAWACFAVSVLTELIALGSRQRFRIRLPGLGTPQRWAAGLLISVAAMVSLPQLGTAATVSAPAAATVIRPVTAPTPSAPPESRPPSAPAAPVAAAGSGRTEALHRHVVEPGDDLWSLAEHYYGEGREWRRIAAANPALLSGGPDRLTPGWVLSIPGAQPPEATAATGGVTVRAGDTLSSIAEREFGDAGRWPELYAANRSLLADPDALDVGMRLRLPPQHHQRTPPAKAQQTAEVTAKRVEAPPEPVASRPEPVPPRPEPVASRPEPVEGQSLIPTTAPSEASAPLPEPVEPRPEPVEGQAGTEVDTLDAAVGLAGVGFLLAASVVAALGWRRRVQLQARPLGRRIAQPSLHAQQAELALGRRQRPLSLRSLDHAMRAIAAHCRATGVTPPAVELFVVGEDRIELVLREPAPHAPSPFVVRGRSWLLQAADAPLLTGLKGFTEASRPWPTLVTLGRDAGDRLVLADLESAGLLAVESAAGFDPAAVLAAMAVELSFSPWADELAITLVGSCAGLPEALGRHNVRHVDDLDDLLARLEQRAAVQRRHHPHPVLATHRVDPDLADPWTPEVVLINTALTDEQQQRLRAVTVDDPRVTLAAVVAGVMPGAPTTIRAEQGEVRLEPAGVALSPQLLPARDLADVVELTAATGSEATTPAPWWNPEEGPPEDPPDNVTYLGRRFGGWTTATGADTETEGGAVVIDRRMSSNGTGADHPMLQLLGPVELDSPAGTPPPRASKQCLEYCAWLLENPASTAQQMGTALGVAEGTRRSNMSRLRTWLGDDPGGEPYLPDAYSGRITLNPAVSSDWNRLRVLTVSGVNRTSTAGLRAALELVRGAPLADAAPGQWHWAEELRTDMISCVRDIGVEVARRAMDSGDLDLARWAASRALAAAPGDELLMAARIRTEHLAGNHAETERLTLQVAAQARALGVDLAPETVELMQEVIEGRVRARYA